MTFYEFICKFLEDDTPLGQLAKIILIDKDFPIYETSERNLHTYFYDKYADHSLLECANRAISIYHINYA
ncbi:sterile alpha motif-like domain-containing protein [Staphylococcus sp. SQ8-PEA]|uniref:Sterile alpha motif-like domain-containing protein n=1 Tax=Staphylococcus marylandisciuri TaxID=2981529 RepID=A0ABT2QSV6_9STAP|nr:sterile alpha motif-like domain-containing protein [Staphylococcus marylandisciuri]MCU5747076.1 sterile alpha motif-like domain-containing protein [Staphylococcus marylandisciuri]